MPPLSASVPPTLARYGLHDNPINRESYTRAREIGQRLGMPAHNFDATLLFSLDSGSSEEAAGDNRHWRRLSEARRLGIPRSWVPGDYQKPVYNQFSLGRQAYILGLAEGSGQRVPIYTVTYEARVVGLVRQVPAFARAVLEIEPTDLEKFSDQEIRVRIRSASNIFTVQDHMIAVQKAFGQFQQNPQAMTADHWDVVMREASDPRASHTKSPAYLRLAGKTELAQTFETFGMVDDHPKVAEVVSKQTNGRVVEVERPKSFTYSPGEQGIWPTLDAMTADNSTRNVLDAIERLPSLSKGQGAGSITRTGIPIPLADPPPLQLNRLRCDTRLINRAL